MSGSGITRAFEHCTIGRWRGYRSSSFVAYSDDGGAIAESTLFRARGGTAPQPTDEDVAGAHAELVATLLASGWETDAEAAPDAWFEMSFVRAIDVLQVEYESPSVIRPAVHPASDADPMHDAAVAPSPTLEPTRPPAPETVEAPEEADERRPTGAWTPRLPEPHLEAMPRRRPARTRGIAAMGLAAAVALAAFVGLGHGLRHEHRVVAPTSAKKTHTPTTRLPHPRHPALAIRNTAAQPAVVQRAPAVRVVISAPTRPSWLEVHRNSFRGPILFAGELPAGRTVRFRATKLWARFGAAGNLSIAANGRLLRLQGTVEHTFSPGD